jgi:tartrate dehydratase alpha subunit/fumarate hydratase class I-like protein
MYEQIHQMTQTLGVGAQFGGKYFAHDVRVIRLPRHGASCPVGMAVSCSADRQVCRPTRLPASVAASLNVRLAHSRRPWVRSRPMVSSSNSSKRTPRGSCRQ